MQIPKFTIDNIPQGKINMMNGSRRASARAAANAIERLNGQIYKNYDFCSLYQRWCSGEWNMPTVNGKFRHEVIRDYEKTLEHLDGIAYNMVRERVCNSITEFLTAIANDNLKTTVKVIAQQQEQLASVQAENARLKAALRAIAENYVLNDSAAIAELLDQHL